MTNQTVKADGERENDRSKPWELDRFARVAAFTALFLAAAIPLLTLLNWFNIMPLEDIEALETFIASDGVSSSRRFGGFLIAMIPKAVLVYGLWRLSQMFQDFSKGNIFTPSTEGHLRVFAWSLFGFVLLDFIIEAPLSAYATWMAPEGSRLISLSFDWDDIHTLLLGMLVFALSRVIAEGARLARENAEFV